ncbi:MAG: DNA recombination protein RmuC [Fimbriimonadaceae bacterium]
MEALWAIGGVVVGLVGGALVALAVARSQSQGAREQAERAGTERDEARKGFDAARSEASEAVARARELQATLDAERKSQEDKLAQLREAKEELTNAFKALSAEALKANNQEFIEKAELRLKPLEEQLRLYEEGLQKLRDTGTRQTTETQEHIKHLVGELHKQRELAGDIKSLLRGPTQRGRMGELMLSTLLERAGLLSGHHYELQSAAEIEGNKRRPDCKVFMPGGHGIVIDSKTPLNAYEDAMECEDEAARAAKMLEHARNVRREIDSLASKEYRREAGEGAIVVMYLPIEASLSAAILQDPKITSYGWDRGVIVTSPTLLFVLLQTVATGWRQEQFRQNTEKVADLGKELVTRVRIVANHMNKLGDSLGKSVNSYNDAIGSMDRNLMATASKFKQLGVGGDSVPELKSSPAHVRTFDKPELGVPPMEEETRVLTDLFLEVETVDPIPVAEAD